MSNLLNRRIVLAKRPHGEPQQEDFRLETIPAAAPADGQVLLRTLYLSLDPYMRGRMSAGPSYAAPVEIDGVMQGAAVSEVVESNDPSFQTGDTVFGFSGWQTYPVADVKTLRKIDPKAGPITYSLGLLGMPGLTAYAGLLNIGQPKSGETVVVAAAAGAVGSVVGQIAKIKGCRAIGIAGGSDKCDFVVKELGFDACLDHRSGNLPAELKAACPQGIDVYFENVGGKVFEAVLPLMNNFGRVPVCGLISQYNATELPPAPDRSGQLMGAILVKRLTLRGFIVSDFLSQQAEFARDMATWLGEGRIKYREDIVDGFENTITAFQGLLKGKNFGKLIVRV